MKKQTKLLIALLSVNLITACGNEPSEDLQDSIVETTPETAASDIPSALFDPSSGVIPFPSDLLFTGSRDGTLNIPVADPSDLSDPQVALNALDGFSTVAPFSMGFSTKIDASSISGSSVKVYEVTLSSTPGGAPVAVNTELTFGVDYVAAPSSVDSTGSTLAILPLKPLDPRSSYTVAITDSLLADGSGEAFGPSITYRLFKNLPDALDCSFPINTETFSNCSIPGALLNELLAINDEEDFNDALASFEGLRQIITVTESTIAAADTSITTDNIIQSWSFTTQSVGDVLTTVQGLIGTPATSLSASTVDLGNGEGVSPLGAANIYEGTIDVPYYLTAPSEANPTALLDEPWQAQTAFGGENNLTALNPVPAATDSSLSIPMLVSTPANPAFAKPWSTVIFQHGITSDRTAMLAIADALGSVGFAVVAIDMPLHGVGSSSPYYRSGNERTFDVDYVTQDSEGNITAAAPDGVVDSSGRHYVNLTNLLVTRDNVRQSVADLFALTAAIPNIDVDGDGADLNGSDIYFVGHSLGAMVGTTFTALQTDIRDAVFAFGGGSLPKILDGSARFSPSIVAGLAAAGVNKGTAAYESFMGAAQTVVDSGDPINYAADSAASRGVLFFEIVGDGGSSPSDLVVPNAVPDGNDTSGLTVYAPLAGTEPMLTLMELTQVDESQSGTSDLKVSVKFTSGDHGSILSPAADAAVTTEMQTQMASFIASGGLGLTVTDTTSIQTAP